jgi:hypothetical protein
MLQAIKNKIEITWHNYSQKNKLYNICLEDPVKYIDEFTQDEALLEHLRLQLQTHTSYAPGEDDFAFTANGDNHFFSMITIYTLTRSLKPDTIVETGGIPGKATAALLKAIKRNNYQGRLWTCSVPHKQQEDDVPLGFIKQHQTPSEHQWIIPPTLLKKDRHQFVLGEIKKTLKMVLGELDRIDMFVHDSTHTYEQMSFELKAAWPHLNKGGILICNKYHKNDAFKEFIRTIKGSVYYIGDCGIAVK